jgi:hypothetical protein
MVILELNKDEVDRWERLMHTYPLDLGEKGLEPDKVLASWKVNILDRAIAELEIFTEKEKYLWARMTWYVSEKPIWRSQNDDVIGGVWDCPLNPNFSVFVNVV